MTFCFVTCISRLDIQRSLFHCLFSHLSICPSGFFCLCWIGLLKQVTCVVWKSHVAVSDVCKKRKAKTWSLCPPAFCLPMFLFLIFVVTLQNFWFPTAGKWRSWALTAAVQYWLLRIWTFVIYERNQQNFKFPPAVSR